MTRQPTQRSSLAKETSKTKLGGQLYSSSTALLCARGEQLKGVCQILRWASQEKFMTRRAEQQQIFRPCRSRKHDVHVQPIVVIPSLLVHAWQGSRLLPAVDDNTLFQCAALEAV